MPRKSSSPGSMPAAVFAVGVDVGDREKGFHLAALDKNKRLLGLAHKIQVNDAADWIANQARRGVAIAVDCPRGPAPDGEKSRESERRLSREICHCYYTPNAEKLKSGDFYGWIRNGLNLYACLDDMGFSPIECFPTASWTRLVGARRKEPKESKAAWTRAGLLRVINSADASCVRDQDQRDAVCAAVTAWLFRKRPSSIDRFGDIHVPGEGASSTASQSSAEPLMSKRR